MLAGHATPAATAELVARAGAAPDFHSEVLGLRLSNLGLGTYLGNPDEATDAGYRAALEAALAAGVNVVDLAINYRAQGSERAIGAYFRERGEELRREELFVATKGGFNPRDRDAPERGGEALLRGIPAEEVVGGSHCLHPRYLERVLARSRENLGLQTLDLYYLHNPETQLGEVSKPIFYERIRRAFTVLEAARERGELQAYGVATWAGLRRAAEDPQALDLRRLVECARSVGGEDHGLRAVQLPFSAALPEALTLAGQSVGEELLPAIPAARALNLAVFTSGPLAQGKLLEQRAPELAAGLAPAQAHLQLARSAADVTLVGMSQVAHVEENLALARLPRSPLGAVRAALG